MIRGLAGAGLRAVKQVTSFRQSGYFFSPAFQDKRWDGYHRLLRNSASGAHTLPSGLVPDALDALRDVGWRAVVTDERRALPPRAEFGWRPGETLRPYQAEAVDAFLDGGGDPRRAGCGILKMSTRSGKTRTAAALIHRLGAPTLFVVTSQILLRQAQRALAHLLPGATVGAFGDSERDIDSDIVVATAQSLTAAMGARSPEWRALVTRDVMIVDECHHLEADAWRDAIMSIEARVRCGLSATVWFQPDGESPEAEDVLLKAATGAVLYEVRMADLMAAGYLMRCDVRLVRVESPDLRGERWSPSLHAAGIYENDYRNSVLVRETQSLARERLRTIVTTNRVKHAQEITDRLLDAGVRATFLIGDHDDDRRARVISDLRERRLDAVVSTVLSEGVDIPECEAVVAGEGGKSRRAALQRMRCLTPAPGKARAVFVDVIDLTHKVFAEHSAARIGAYRAEGAFDFVVADPAP